ncbi:FG-GAP repeat domain-containing protein [Shewanella sp. GXUN23E]|uniref:FG-GAP repeat domain-containing protein n=1 Tax=Shewanella sp. GXUN23E TaxID=3422498 RepID=UPI003D7D0DDD
MPLLPFICCLILLWSFSSFAQAKADISFDEQTLSVPFKLTHKVAPVDLLPAPGKELLVIGVDDLQQKWLAVFAQSDASRPGIYQLQGKMAIPPDIYRFDIYQPDKSDHEVGQVFFLASDKLYRLNPYSLSDSRQSLEPILSVPSMSLQSRADFMVRGNLVYALDDNPLPDLLVQGLQGVTVLGNVGPAGPASVQQLPVIPHMLLYPNGARYMQPRLFSLDANFDGLPDLLSVGEGDLQVFFQQASGRYVSLPDYLAVSQPINGLEWWWQRDAWGEEPDQSKLVHRFVEDVKDVNADGISDLVVRYARSSGVLDRVNDYEIYYGLRNDGRLGFGREADTLISGEGTLTGFEFVDLDGDNRQEVLVAGFDIGLSQVISALLSGSIDEDVYLFKLDEAGQYSKKPGFADTVELSFSISSGETGEPVILLADVNGDGFRDLLLSGDEQHLKIFPGKAGSGMFDNRNNKVRLPLPQKGNLLLADDINGDGRDDLLISYGRQATAAQQTSFVVLTSVAPR